MRESPENHKEIELEKLVDFKYIPMIVNGSKPGCLVQLVIKDENDPIAPEEYAQEIARRYDLECIRAPSAIGNEIPEEDKYTPYAIAKKRKVSDLLAEVKLPEVPEIKDRVPKIIDEIKNMTIAEAIAYIGKIPRIDDKFDMVQEKNLERPEVTLMDGVLLGYKPCCVEHYIKKRYLDQGAENLETFRKQSQISEYFGKYDDHELCDDCVNREYEKMQEEKHKAKGGFIDQIRNLFGKIF